MPNHAIDAIRERWLGASWIVELVSTGRCDGQPFHHIHLIHLFITTLRTSPKALLRLVRQRWAIENHPPLAAGRGATELESGTIHPAAAFLT
jgi:hypothetical protein